MDATTHGWKIFDAGTPVLIYEYGFGPGSANALALGAEGGLIVISPPCNVGDGVFDDLARYGTVRALVAPNAFHHLGLALWRERYPSASVYAPAQAIERLQRQTGQKGFRPLSEAVSVTGSQIDLAEMPHCRTGETLVCVRTERGPVWYITDIVINMPRLPEPAVARWVFKLSHSAPGLKFNNLAGLVMVKDKRALKRWLAAQIDKAQPRWLIPGHGDVLKLGAAASTLRSLFVAG